MLSSTLTTWDTIKIGVPSLRERADFLRRFVTENPCHDKCLGDFIEVMPIDARRDGEEIRLALVSVGDLGFTTESTKRKDFFDKMELFGLGKVPTVAGFYLRAKHEGRVLKEKFHMAMDPVVLKKFGPCGLFIFEHYITGDCADPTNSLSLDCRFACRILD